MGRSPDDERTPVSMITLFCLRMAGDAPPPVGLRGPAGAAVRRIEEGDLGMWISEGVAGAPDLETVRAHDAVIRAALRSATPLPVRYGTVFADEDAAWDALRGEAGERLAALERVRGRVEMGVRVLRDAGDPADSGGRGRAVAVGGAGRLEGAEVAEGGGRAYLLARRRELEADAERRAQADRLLDRLERLVNPDGCPAVRLVAPEPSVLGIVAHLVHRADAGQYRGRVERAGMELSDVHLRVSGPWAPYSFA